MNTRTEKFKDSPKSLCAKCVNKEKDCFDVSKYCSGTDKNLGVAYVTSCMSYEKKDEK